MKRLVLLAALVAVGRPLAAQHRADGVLTDEDFQRVRPESCPAANSLAGHPLARPKQGAQGIRREGTHQVFSAAPFEFTAHRPVDGIMLNVAYDREGPLPRAGFTLALHLRDSVLRSGPDARFTLILDSTEVPVGGMEASPTRYSYGHTIDQMLTIPIPIATVQQLVAASAVKGRIGTWEFPVPDKTIETFHAVFIAGVCGVHLR